MSTEIIVTATIDTKDFGLYKSFNPKKGKRGGYDQPTAQDFGCHFWACLKSYVMLMLWSLMNMSKTLWSVMLLYGLHGDMTWKSKNLWIHYDLVSICNLSMKLWAKSYDLWVKPGSTS